MIANQAEALSRDWMTLLLAGLGISFFPYAYIGGLFLALAGASLAMHFDRDTPRIHLFGVMMTAFFVSHIAALIAQAWAPSFQPQLVMAGAGFASRYVARIAIRMFGRVEKRSDVLADRITDRILPKGPDEKQ